MRCPLIPLAQVHKVAAMTMNKAMSLKTKKAACAGASGRLWRVSGWAGNGDGLKSNFKGSACIRRRARAMMLEPRAIAGHCELGGSFGKPRRTIAAPLRGVFLWRLSVALMALLRPHSVRARRAGSLRACRYLGSTIRQPARRRSPSWRMVDGSPNYLGA